MSQIAEYDPKDFENPSNATGVYARFYMRPIQNEARSAEEGRPVFDDVEFVEIIAAGNATNIVRRPVRDSDRQRFAQSYHKFRAGADEQLSGTLLTEVAWVSASQREELAYIKVRTLEHLAELNDQACSRIPGLYELKRKAGAWLAKAKDEAPFLKMTAENDALRAENEALRAELTERMARLEESVASSKPTKKSAPAAE